MESVIHEELLGGNSIDRHKFDLFVLVVPDRDRPRNLIELILEEFSLLDGCGRQFCFGCETQVLARESGLRQPLKIAGDQLQAGVLVGGPARVPQSDPAVQVD